LLIKKIIEISPSKYNPRTISDESMGRLTKSLAEFGNIQPITWNARTGNVVGGHQRLKVYQAMGKTEVEVWAVDLSEQKEKAANIALNKLSGEFDMPMLKDILEEIDTGDLDMEVTGFAMDEIAEMMESVHPIEEDEVPEVPVDAITKLGDLWLLGEHRVLCGDSTKAEDVARLMNGEKVNCLITDPPYGIDWQGSNASTVQWQGIANDTGKLNLSPILRAYEIVVAFGANCYPHQLPHRGRWICWDKRVNENADRMLGSPFELAWTSNTSGFDRIYRIMHGGVVNDDGHNARRVHPTQKPIRLMASIIKDYADGGDIVDLFSGSGTTLVAAEQLGRKCYGMEISPNYCDVIVKRWENLTNKKATLAK
jgi:16S rRNA G966 N2-methylase RsmD